MSERLTEQKGWLCMKPLTMQTTVGGVTFPLQLPQDALAALGVFKTKRAAQAVFGPKAPLLQVSIPKEADHEH